jgi:hypothetical protein
LFSRAAKFFARFRVIDHDAIANPQIAHGAVDVIGGIVKSAVGNAEERHARSVCHSGQKAIRFFSSRFDIDLICDGAQGVG